jgi:diketogulonate reductase-like aldo/keto reductase
MASTLRLRTGAVLPSIGLGTWKSSSGDVAEVVYQAIKAGWRHLDCAADYGNEQEVGAGIKRALDEGICQRADLFVTSKLWNTFHQKQHVEMACRKSLSDLGLDYLDLYLIHFPISLKFVPIEERYPPEWTFKAGDAMPGGLVFEDVPIRETWEGMEGVADAGLAKAIGVSNFSAALCTDLLKYARIKPAVNQIELHPYNAQHTLVKYLQANDIVVTGYSPLGIGSYVPLGAQGKSVLEEDAVVAAAKAHGKSPAQVVLRWAVQRGTTVVPKTASVKRLQENLDVFSFELTAEEMAALDALDRGVRYNDPATYANSPIFA